MHRPTRSQALWLALLASFCSCAEAIEAPLDVLVDADASLRERVSEVRLIVELREEGDAAWQTVTERRFELGEPGDWPLRFDVDVDPAADGDAYALRANARDARAAVLADAYVVVSSERAREEGLRVKLEQREPDVEPEPAVAPECLGMELDVPFCEGERLLVCSRERLQVRPCGSNERCVSVDQNARCACLPGFVHSAERCVRAEP